MLYQKSAAGFKLDRAVKTVSLSGKLLKSMKEKSTRNSMTNFMTDISPIYLYRKNK